MNATQRLICLTALFFGIAFSTEAQVLFRTNQFNVLRKDLSLVENTQIIDTILRLTPSAPMQRGACWYVRKQIDLSKGFETEFTFKIHQNDAKLKGGDGFAFVIQAEGPNVIGGTGDEIGYKAIPNAVVIEFDTHKDADDKTRNQVALMKYDPQTRTYHREATVHEIRELNNGQEHFARIEYKNGFLVFFMDSYLFPVLSFKLDIPERLGKADNMAWIGFTSATGNAYSHHDILSWSLSEFLPPPEDIKEEKIEVTDAEVIEVKSRKISISVWDHNRIDGDIISLKLNDHYVLTRYPLEAAKKTVPLRITGFNARLILYAHNLGDIPPNTAAIEIDDGISKQVIKLKASLEQSEAIVIQYTGDDL
jgi:hypothetical protein